MMKQSKIITTDKDVLVIPQEIMDHFGGEIIHPNKSARLTATIDPDGDAIIGMEVLDDPDWDFLGTIDFGGKKMRELMTVKKYRYFEENWEKEEEI